MSESLFQIGCPSCESVFAVTDPALVGQIIACPKCGGMMLVEAAEVAQNADAASNDEEKTTAQGDGVGERFSDDAGSATEKKAAIGETAQNGGVGDFGRNGESVGTGGTGEAGENGEAGRTGAVDEKADAANAGETAAPSERSRGGGKFVASGIAILLVGGLAFWGLRGFQDESAPVAETGVETTSGENDGNSENDENGELRGAADDEENDVGGFAPFAVEEREGNEEGGEPEELEFAQDVAAPLEEGEETTLDGSETSETNNGISENGEDGGDGEDAQNLGNESNVDGDETSDLENAGNAESGTNKENAGNSEVDEDAGISEDGEDVGFGEDALDETLGEDDDLTGVDEELGALEDLGGGSEDEPLAVAENEENDALDESDEETSEGEKLTGSNAATGFNEADFERANQNDDPENDEPAEVDWSGVASTASPTLQSALPSLRRERKEIDVDARLALPIKSIEFPSSPVAAIRILSEFTGVSIVPDLEPFVLTRLSANATLDLSLRDVTAGEALEKVAELLNWEVCKEKDRVLIRPLGYQADAIVEERFDVADLTTPNAAAPAASNAETPRLEMFELPNNLTPESLAALIESTVAPETWVEQGGAATLTLDGSTLAVAQNAANREKTRILLEGLRALRGLEPQNDAAPERIVPEKLGWENLMKKTNFAPLTPPALQNAIEILEKSQKFQVFWDDVALIEAGVGRDATTAARIENGTVDAALSEILEPLNATYLILGEKLIYITDSKSAENYQTVEFFSVVAENGERPTLAEARALVEEIKRTVAPESWRTNDAQVGNAAFNADEAEVASEAETFKENDATSEVGENGGNDENSEFEEEAEVAELGGLSALEGVALNEESDASTDAIENNPRETSAFDEDASEGAPDVNDDETAFGEAAANGRSATIWLDVESSCLIVRQTQPNQRALRRWLTARLANSENRSGNKTENRAE